MADAKKILIEYENGTVKEINKGIVAEFDKDNMHVDMVSVSKMDLVRIAYGMIATVEKMGMTPLFQAYASGELLPDEVECDSKDTEDEELECGCCQREDAPCDYCIRNPENPDKEDPDLEDCYHHD